MLQKKILITGASGRIGKLIWAYLSSFPGRYDLHGLDRTSDLSYNSWGSCRKGSIPQDKFMIADISDHQRVSDAMKGIDTVIHLAANPCPYARGEDILNSNVRGLYNIFEASRTAGVKRIIYASSIRVIEGYSLFVEPYASLRYGYFNRVSGNIPLLSPYAPVRPTEIYGASKVFGEAMARVYSDMHGISCLSLRIGQVSSCDRPSPEQPDVWCSHRDISRIIQLCVDAPETLTYDVFYCVSESRFKCVDTSNLHEKLGFAPADNEKDRRPET